MDNKTEYGEWLSAQMVMNDAEIDAPKERTERNTYEAESDIHRANAALQLVPDRIALKLQGIAPTSDTEWENCAFHHKDHSA